METPKEKDVGDRSLSKIPILSEHHLNVIRSLTGHKFAIVGLLMLAIMIVAALFAPYLAPYDPEQPKYDESLQSPSFSHPFGTDSFGRDVLSRVIFGARISILVGLSVISISILIGVPLGLLAGYYSDSIIDPVIMRLTDSILAFPSIILALTIMALIGSSLVNVVLALAIVNIPVFVRLVRGNVLSVKEEDYIQSAKAVGSSDAKIIYKHVLPNVLTPIIVQGTLVFAFAILAESALSFLGVGTSPPTPSWGLMLNEGKEYLEEGFWISMASGGAIMVAVLGLNFLGDALRDILDPRHTDETLR